MKNWDNKLTGNFTTVPNQIVNDKAMSAKAKGVLLYLASKPNDWNFYMEEICMNFTDGITAIKSAVKELERNGYLTRKRAFDEKTGQIRGYKWTLHMKATHQTENPPDGKASRRNTMLHTNTESTNTDNTKKDTLTIYGKGEEIKEILDRWNEIYDCQLRLTTGRINKIRSRLKNETAENIITAMQNRSANKYWRTKEGKPHRNNFDSFIRSDEQVDKYLNQEASHTYTSKEELPF